MKRTLITLTGSSQATLIDRDIAHIGRVMRPSLHGDLGGPILPATYWRKRLYQLLDSGHLSTRSCARSTASCSRSTSSKPNPCGALRWPRQPPRCPSRRIARAPAVLPETLQALMAGLPLRPALLFPS